MTGTVIFELEQNRKRLDYYTSLKEKTASITKSKKVSSASPTDKWIEIYAERVQKLERQLKRIQNAAAAAAAEAEAEKLRAQASPGLRIEVKKVVLKTKTKAHKAKAASKLKKRA